MDKLGKLGSSVTKKFQGKTNSNNNSGGQSLQQIVKEATAKTLRRPDSDLNQQVVDLIGSAIHNEGPREVAKILTDRLSLKNPHKVWLAVELIREVLSKCGGELAPVRDDIMAEVRKVASDAMKRFNSNLADQQRAKAAAFDLLRTYGHDGHILSQPHLEQQGRTGAGGVSPHSPGGGQGQHASSWPALAEQVQTQIAVAISHNDLLQDMLLDTTPLASRSSEQRQLAEEVIMEAKKFRTGFEQLLAQLGQYDTPQANELLTTGLEKLDVLNNSLNVHKENLKKQLKAQLPSTATGPTGQKPQGVFEPSPTPKPAPDAGLGSLLELQQGLDAANQPPQQPAHDPFQASSQWQQPPPVQQHHQPHQHQPPQGQGQPSSGPPPAWSQPPQQNPFSAPHGNWPSSGQMPIPTSYPGYGYSGYNPGYGYGYNPGYGPAPPPYSAPPQGYGQPGQWQGYPPNPGYGYQQNGAQSYRPQQQYSQAGNPYHQQPQQQQPPASGAPQPHVPAPFIQATINVPEQKRVPTPSGSGRLEQATSVPHSPGFRGASTPKPAQSEQLQLQPPTPPAAAAAPSGAAASTTPSPDFSPQKPSASASGIGTQAQSAGPDSGATPFMGGYVPANGAAQPHVANGAQKKAAAPTDEWDLFFTERVGSEKLDDRAASRAGPKGQADQLTNAFGQLSASRKK